MSATSARERVAAKVEALYGRRYDAGSEITITAGATQGILTAILAIVSPGDEVIVLEPCYDSYVPNIELTGAAVVRVPLTPGTFRPDFGKIGAALSPRTRAIVINSPHNPSGTVWSAADMRRLEELLAPTNVLVISDEVYEHIVYPPYKHVYFASLPGMFERTISCSSLSKTFSITGWRLGYIIAPSKIIDAARKVHDFLTVGAPAPLQEAA